MITLFGFKDTISEKVLHEVEGDRKYILTSEVEAIENFVEQVLLLKPAFILGMGEYSGRDQDKLRVEERCTHKFRNRRVGEIPSYEIRPFEGHLRGVRLPNEKLQAHLGGVLMKHTRAMGNSYCNLVSYLLMHEITKNKLRTKYGFIHIPRFFDVKIAGQEIQNLLKHTRRV